MTTKEMYDKGLRCRSRGFCNLCKDTKGCVEYDDSYIPKVQWISVKDRMPEAQKIIVVYSEGTYYPPAIATWATGYGFTMVSGDNRTCWKVTHWMPLPELPISK